MDLDRPDRVDRIAEQWQRERPDVDVSAMEVIGRVSRIERLLRPALAATFAEHDLEAWEFDVLATLRRNGEPFRLTAGDLLASTMVTSGAMTHRIDRLSERGLVRREPDADDGRVVLVSLTAAGRDLIDAALPDHASNEQRLIARLTARDRAELVRLLRRLFNAVSDAGG